MSKRGSSRIYDRCLEKAPEQMSILPFDDHLAEARYSIEVHASALVINVQFPTFLYSTKTDGESILLEVPVV